MKKLLKSCSQCLFSEEFCLCPQKAHSPIHLPLKLIFVMNKSEFFRLSNSARIFLQNTYPCEFRIRGYKEAPFDYTSFGESLEETENYLLFPHKEAKTVTLEKLVKEKKKPVNLIVPDGNWSQASKIANKLVREKNITAIALKEPPRSQYKLRSNPNAEKISTFEATFWALKDLLSEEDQVSLRGNFQQLVTNVMKLRGKLPRKS